MNSLTMNLFALIGIPALIVCGAVAGVMWWRQRKSQIGSGPAVSPQGATPGTSGGGPAIQVRGLFLDAENALKHSTRMKGASISTLPGILVVGPPGAGKTSVILHSGIDPELLAGQVYQGSEVLPTSSLNIWLAHGTIFVEISAAVALDESAIKAVLKHLTPGRISSGFRPIQPSRGIILCVGQDAVGSAVTPDEVIALARPWNRLVSLAATTLGVQLPAYVLFTRTDALAGFEEFFSNLSPRDLAQAVGATIRPFTTGMPGVYAEDTSRLLTEHFLNIMHCLCDCRVPVLNREPDRARVALEYQFPRGFGKLQKNIVQFLVEVARPGQLQASPFLRGFYFCGTRKVIVDGPETAAVQVSPVAPDMGMLAATRVMSAELLKTQMSPSGAAPALAARRTVTEWLFLPALFQSVILRDRPAHGASALSSRTDRVRAAALLCSALLGIALLIALTVSYARNRALERELIFAGKALNDPGAPVTIFSRLDRMRKPIERLISYRADPPLSMRWGLYRGDELLAPAEAVYCSAIRNQVLPPVLQWMSARLGALGNARGDHAQDVRVLKAYMMMTTHPRNVDEPFLAQQLSAIRSETAGRPATPMLPAEFRLYAALLSSKAQRYCVNPESPGLIASAQKYLGSLNPDDRYQSLLQAAGRGLDPVDYNRLFPNDAVSDGKIVPGWFTYSGWKAMQELLEHPEKSLEADAWVLGESNGPARPDSSVLAAEFRIRYFNEYVKAWKDFLDSARVTPYASLNDAAAKLEKMASQKSVLLSLIGLAAEHTARIDKVKTIFQPASAAVPAPGDFQTSAGSYLEDLNSLKNRLSKASQSKDSAHEQDIGEARTAAATARDALDRMALKNFRGETDQIVKEILLKPIILVDRILGGEVNKELDAGAKDLCDAFGRVSGRLPFHNSQQGASMEDIQRLFQPETGQMWQFYNKSLRDSLDCFDATCSPRTSPKVQLSRGFIDFFRSLNRWSHLLYAGGRESVVRLQARATPLNHLKQIEIVFSDQRVTLNAAAADFQPVNWDPGRSQKLHVTGVFEGEPGIQTLYDATGLWAIFDWFYNAEPGSGSEGFTWLPRSGTTTPSLLSNGSTKRYKLEIRTGDGTARPLDLRSLAIGGCGLPAAK